MTCTPYLDQMTSPERRALEAEVRITGLHKEDFGDVDWVPLLEGFARVSSRMCDHRAEKWNAALRHAHSDRVRELITANNCELQRRRNLKTALFKVAYRCNTLHEATELAVVGIVADREAAILTKNWLCSTL